MQKLDLREVVEKMAASVESVSPREPEREPDPVGEQVLGDAWCAGIVDKGGRVTWFRGAPGIIFYCAREHAPLAFRDHFEMGTVAVVPAKYSRGVEYRYSVSGPHVVEALLRLRPHMRDEMKLEELDAVLDRYEQEMEVIADG